MPQQQRRMIGHGAIVMLIGLIAGFGLAMELVGGFEVFPGTILGFDLPSDSRAWARAHVGGMMNGLLVMVGALLIWGLQVPARAASQLFWMLVGTGYANTVFYWGGLFAGSHRALTFGDNPLGDTSVMGVIGLLPAFVFAFVAMIAMIILARHAFAETSAKTSE